MKKTILLTGSTDGIGLAAAVLLTSAGHNVLLHGRNPAKLASASETIAALRDGHTPQTYVADLSRLTDVEALAHAVSEQHPHLDALVNNAGVFQPARAATQEGLDTRFTVNTIAPYQLTKRLLPHMNTSSRVINVSSAAQAPVDLDALAGRRTELSDNAAYAQSKLAITQWSRGLAVSLGDQGPAVIAVNPGSMLGTKMVRGAFGVAGGDVQIGAKILFEAAVSERFANGSGQYFDNDAQKFGPAHPDATDTAKIERVIAVIEDTIQQVLGSR